MDVSTHLSGDDRRAPLRILRSGRGSIRYAHVVILVADGFSVRAVLDLAYASLNLINMALYCFRADGVAALTDDGKPSPRKPGLQDHRLAAGQRVRLGIRQRLLQ